MSARKPFPAPLNVVSKNIDCSALNYNQWTLSLPIWRIYEAIKIRIR